MPKETRFRQLVWPLLIPFAVIVAVVVLARHSATAAGDAPPSIESIPMLQSPPPRAHFTQYPAGTGAVDYDQQSAAEQAALDRMAEWAEADHGHGVHQAWSRGSRDAARRAKRQAAQHQAGLEGIDDLGVQ